MFVCRGVEVGVGVVMGSGQGVRGGGGVRDCRGREGRTYVDLYKGAQCV